MRSLYFGIADLVAGTALLMGIWLALPIRTLLVDVVGTALALALWVVGVAFVSGRPWAWRAARWVAWGVLVSGALLVSLLCWTVSYLVGLYGPVGQGGAIILAVVAMLLLPYLVVLPALHLVALLPSRKPPVG